MSRSFPYRRRQSPLFGQVLRPLVDFEIRSKVLDEWTTVENALADTGADASLIPSSIGSVLVEDITSGPRTDVGGVVPGARLPAYLHSFTYRLGKRVFEAPTFIADVEECPVLLGRMGALDRWRATYAHGRVLRIRK